MSPSPENYLFHLEGRVVVPTKSLEDHLRWELETPHEQKVVGKDFIKGVEVSTVFLAHNHNFRGGPPLVFETMIFGGGLDHYQARYSTWEEAEKGHAEAVARVLALPPESFLKTRLERAGEDD
jgi:hypothetical protein